MTLGFCRKKGTHSICENLTETGLPSYVERMIFSHAENSHYNRPLQKEAFALRWNREQLIVEKGAAWYSEKALKLAQKIKEFLFEEERDRIQRKKKQVAEAVTLLENL